MTDCTEVAPAPPNKEHTQPQPEHVAALTQLLKRLTGDCAALLLVLTVSMAVASTYLSAHAQRSPYLLKYYGTAVMVAKGHGFVQPLPEASTPLSAFLENKRTAVKPEEIPDDIKTTSPSQFEFIHRHAMNVLGWWWRFFGISWAALDGLLALMFGITCACAYGVLRLGMGRLLALALVTAFLFSPAMLYILPQFRDFSKAPFIVAMILLTGLPIRYRLPWPHWLLSALGLGLTLGVGLGFRQDLLVVLPIACIATLFFWAGPWRETLLLRLASVALLLAAFWLAGASILGAARNGANSSHNVVLGFATVYEEAMDLEAPYQTGHLYRDAFAHTSISAYNLFHSPGEKGAAYWSGEYEPAGRHYLWAIARTFPYDLLRRALRAEEIILGDSPFTLDLFERAFYPQPEYLEEVQNERMAWFGRLRHAGLALAIVTYFVLAAVRLRWALSVAFIVSALTGYTSLQFHVRHYFPYELFFFFALGFLLHALYVAATLHWRPGLAEHLFGPKPRIHPTHWPALKRMAWAARIAVVTLAVPLLAAAYVQHAQVGRLYESYAHAARTPLEMDAASSPKGPLLKPANFLPPESASARDKAFRVQPGVLAVQVRTGAAPYRLEFVYDADSALNDFGQFVTVPATPKIEDWWVYVPIYQTTDSYFGGGQRRFAGIRAHGAPNGAVRKVYALDNPAELPLLLTLAAPGDLSHISRTLHVKEEGPRE